MVTIQEARQNIENARQQIEEQKAIAEENRRRIEEQKRRLPDEQSQRSLRTKLSGLKGRETRRTISGLRKDLSTKEQLISKAQQEISGYGGEVSSYEENLNKYEQEVKAIQEQQSALKAVEAAAEKDMVWALAMYGEGLEQEYAQKWLKMENIEQTAWLDEVADLQASYPTEKLLIDYDNMKIVGVESGEFGSSMSIDAYNKRMEQLQKQAGSIQEKIDLSIPKMDIVEPPKTSIFNSDMFPMVSALTTSSIKQPAEKKQGIISSSLGKASSFIERTPVLREIAKPSLIWEELSSKYPKSTKVASSFFFSPPEIRDKVTQIWNPILSASIPTARITTTIRVPTRQIREPSFVEIQQPVSVSGKDITIGAYKLTREVSPPQLFFKNVKGSGLLGTSDIIKRIPARIETTFAPRIIGDAPFSTYTTKFGQSVKLGELSGSSVPVTTAEFESLSNTQKFLWTRVAEDIAGRPVSIKIVPKILKENQQLARGYIEQVNKGRYNLQNIKETPARLGKETSRFETASSFKKVGESAKAEFYKGNIFFKDVTKPFSRATGKTPKVKGTIIRIKEPIVIGNKIEYVELFHGTTKEAATRIKQYGFKGDTSLTTNKEFAQSFANRATVKESLKGIKTEPEILNIKVPKEEFFKAKETTKSKFYDEVVINKEVPYKINDKQILKEGEVVKPSLFQFPKGLRAIKKDIKTSKELLKYGKYGILVGSISGKSLLDSKGYNVDIARDFSRGFTSTSGVQITKEASAKENQDILTSQENLVTTKNISYLKPVEELKPMERTQNIPKQVQSPLEVLTPKEIQKIGLSQIQLFKQKETTKPRQIQTPKPAKPTIPKIPIKPPVKSPSITKRILKKIEEEPETFEIFVTKGGKDISLGKKETQVGAEMLLKSSLKSTLRAGGFITKGTKQLKATELKSFRTGEFGLSKVSPYKIIQKKEMRFGTGGETKEAQYFRKTKKGGLF